MKIFIGVPTAEFARHAAFYDYLELLLKPEGTMSAGFHLNSAAWNRNLIIKEALYYKCSHVLFIDDDMAFPPDALNRLLAHDLDMVGALYFNRCFPMAPLLYDDNPEDPTRPVVRYLADGDKGVVETAATGFGFLLVKTEVFMNMAQPWVRLGEIIEDRRNEDIGFFNRARALGYKLHVDLETVVGHIGTVVFWPNRMQGKWYTAIDTHGVEMINYPQLTKEEVNEQVQRTSREDEVLSRAG